MSEGPRLCVMPAGALEDVIAGQMSEADLRVLAALGTFTDRQGWTHPIRQERLADRCGFRREQVCRSLRRLEWLGWVQVKRAERTDRPSAYRVRLDPDDLRAPGAAPSVGFEAWKRACAAAARRKAGKAAKPEVATGESPVESGESAAPLCATAHKAPVRDCAQGPVRELDHTPCAHSAHSSYDSLSRKESPLPPFEAGAVSGATQGREGERHTGEGQSGGGCIAGDTGSGMGQSPAASAAEGAHCSAGQSEPHGLSMDGWRGVRADLKASLHQHAYAAHVARLRLVSGRVVATSLHEARSAASAIGGALKAAGIQSIHIETGEAVTL